MVISLFPDVFEMMNIACGFAASERRNGYFPILLCPPVDSLA